MRVNKKPSKLIDSLVKRFRLQHEFLGQLGPKLVEEAQARLKTKKSDPEGKKWRPWASSTAMARRREGSAALGLLYRTGELHDELEYEVIGPKVVVRSRKAYAQYLQNGTSRMPARPFLGMGKVERQIVQELWNKWIGDE